jgi:Cu(I)/Ag(I) efflux system protein CusF
VLKVRRDQKPGDYTRSGLVRSTRRVRWRAEVRKVDKAAAKLTLKHGEIKHLDMPPMTMVFQVRDKALLDTVKAGDKVRFRAAQEGGQYVVTAIEVVR